METIKSIKITATSVLLIFILSSETSAQQKNISKFSPFNSKAAFSELNVIKKQIITKPKDLNRAKLSLNRLGKLQTQAETCIEKANTKLTILNNLLKNLQSLEGQTGIKKEKNLGIWRLEK